MGTAHTPSRPSTSTEAGLHRNFRRSDVGLANTSRRQRKGLRLLAACATPSAGPGFVVVGSGRATGKTYTPGRDDISQEQGYNVFEYVEPWRVFTTFPEEASSNVGQKVFLAGLNVRPNRGATISAVGATCLHFVSSALAVCESEPRASRSTGVLMLQHDSHGAPEGQQLTVRRRATPTISYSGRSCVSLGESLSLSSSTADESGSTLLSWEARIGCQFGAWVAASARTAVGRLDARFPCIGERSDVSDGERPHSLTLGRRHPSAAVDAPNSGRMALTVREAMQVEMITPFAVTPVARMNARGVDVFGATSSPEYRSEVSAAASTSIRDGSFDP